MSFRSRLALGFAGLTVLVTGAVGVLVRHQVRQRLERQYAAQVAGLTELVRRDVAREHEDVFRRLRGAAAALREDNRFRLGLVRSASGDDYVRDWAGRIMRPTGLDVFQVQTMAGTIVSSGHFRNAFGALAAGLPEALGDAGGPALLRSRTPEGAALVLAAADTVTVAGRRLYLVGGSDVGGAVLGRLPAVPSSRVRLEYAGGSIGPATLPDPGITGEIRLPLLDATGERLAVGSARLVVAHSLAPLTQLTRDVGLFLATVGLAGAVGAGLLGWWMAGWLARPLARLAHTAGDVRLETDVRFEGAARSDEIGVLARALQRMTDGLRASAQRLRAAERRMALGDVARQVNHDVKNGLVPIRNVVRHLIETAEGEPERLVDVLRERRETLEGGIDYLDRLSRSYARLTPVPLASSADLNRVIVETTVSESVRHELSDDLPPVQGDATVLRRIVENLVQNAQDAVAAAGAGTVTVRTQRTGAGARMIVADTGPGMTRAQLERAFEGFYTTKSEGTGLGLTVVRRLVQDLGGDLRIETEPGAGTTVTVDLPPSRGPVGAPGEGKGAGA